MTTIPASAIVNVTPNVLSAGGNALDMNGLLLTTNTRVPIGDVQEFANSSDVATFFGSVSDEALAAAIYFSGFDNSNSKPGAMLFAQYNEDAVSAYLRSGSFADSVLADVTALSGTVIVTVDGSSQTGTVNLSGATSFSEAADTIEAALNLASSVTGSVAINKATGTIAINVGTGSIAGTTLTISAITTGGFAPGQIISGTGVVSGTTIVSQLTGVAGLTGTYQVSVSQTVASTTITATGGTFSADSALTGTFAVGQTLTGTGVTAGTTITALLTGTGGLGTYAVSIAQTTASTTITASGGTLTVTAVATGTIGIGDIISGAGITVGTTVTAFITGVGLTGTYFVSVSQTAASTTITIAGGSVIVTYDSVSSAFKIESAITGAASTITFATGTIATGLKLTSATGAVLSQGAAAAAPAAFMTALVLETQNWALFTTLFDPDTAGFANKLLFADWVSGQNSRYVYVAWDTDESPKTTNPATSSFGYAVAQADHSGVCLVSASSADLAAFVMGAAASIDFEETNGRITFAFRSQAGISPTIDDETSAANLIANRYNFYGAYATANDSFQFFYPGSVSGDFLWLDSFVNQIWLNNSFQLALMTLLTNANSIPYNAAGNALIEAGCADSIEAGLNFGAFRSGVTLSASQIAQVNSDAGVPISDTLSDRGWYLQVLEASAAVRQARGSPPCKFWYMDGGAVQQIDITSILVQ